MAAQVNTGASAGPDGALAAVVSAVGREVYEVAGVYWVQPVSFFIANGVAQVEEQIVLPRNALVDDYQVVVQALPAYSVPLSLVAQVRDSDDQGQNALVIDFGTMVTINGLWLPSPGVISGVKMWVGTQFSTQFAYPRNPNAVLNSGADFTEIKTERLLVRYTGAISASDVLEEGLAYLADPPSGLELRIDDGPPVWSHPAAVRLGSDGTLSEAAWNDQAKRLVDLTAALQALTGDPLAPDDPINFKLTLSARLPCLLDLAPQGIPAIRRIRRVRIAGTETISVVATEEGRQSVALALPPPAPGANRRVTEVRLTGAGSFAPDRTLPPVGPPAALGPAVAGSAALVPVAELVVDAAHAVCLRLGAAAGLDELRGVRLPLAAGPGGCELRVTVRDTLSIDPAAKVVSQTSDPVTLAEGGEAWTSFAFKTAFALDPAALPWLVLTAARGEAMMAVAADGAISGDPLAVLVDAAEIRRGPPGGPWQVLPSPLALSPADGGAIAARGRLRLVGLPPKAAPLPPLVLQLAGDAAVEPLTPNARGVPLTLIPATPLPATNPILDITAYAPGALTLSAIDVITLE